MEAIITDDLIVPKSSKSGQLPLAQPGIAGDDIHHGDRYPTNLWALEQCRRSAMAGTGDVRQLNRLPSGDGLPRNKLRGHQSFQIVPCLAGFRRPLTPLIESSQIRAGPQMPKLRALA